MRETKPAVFLVARPSVDVEAMRAYLEDVGGAGWLDRRLGDAGAAGDAELLVEFGGRLCYRSWEPGLNANVTGIRHAQEEYFENLLRSAHGSVLEHASYSFAFSNVSRVSHPRAGPASRRLGLLAGEPALRAAHRHRLSRAARARADTRPGDLDSSSSSRSSRSDAADRLGIDEDGLPFAVKKEVTSALRRLAPSA